MFSLDHLKKNYFSLEHRNILLCTCIRYVVESLKIFTQYFHTGTFSYFYNSVVFLSPESTVKPETETQKQVDGNGAVNYGASVLLVSLLHFLIVLLL